MTERLVTERGQERETIRDLGWVIPDNETSGGGGGASNWCEKEPQCVTTRGMGDEEDTTDIWTFTAFPLLLRFLCDQVYCCLVASRDTCAHNVVRSLLFRDQVEGAGHMVRGWEAVRGQVVSLAPIRGIWPRCLRSGDIRQCGDQGGEGGRVSCHTGNRKHWSVSVRQRWGPTTVIFNRLWWSLIVIIKRGTDS